MKLIIASNNGHKIKEIKKILGDRFDEILSLREAGIDHETVEDGKTFLLLLPLIYLFLSVACRG